MLQQTFPKRNIVTAILFTASLTSVANAVESADMTITGRILPVSCNVSLASNTADFGAFAWTEDGRNSVEDISNELTLSCDGNTKAIVETTYEQESVNGKTGVKLGDSGYAVAGLTLDQMNATTGTTNMISVWKYGESPTSDRGSWTAGNEGLNSGDVIGVSDDNDHHLTNGKGFVVPLNVALILDTSKHAPANVVALSGTATFTINYL